MNHEGWNKETGNPNRLSVGGIEIHTGKVLNVALVKRAASMGKVDIILGQQCIVDRRPPPMASQGEGAHVGNHQRQNQAVASGHFKDDKDRCHGSADDAGKNGAHADHGKGADGVGRVVEDHHIKIANRTTKHGTHKERRREDAARAAA